MSSERKRDLAETARSLRERAAHELAKAQQDAARWLHEAERLEALVIDAPR